MSLISLTGATFDRGREKILHEVNLSVFAGLKYALIGENGAGKTTLLAVLAGELPLHAGVRQAASRAVIRFLRQETAFAAPREDAAPLYDAVLRAAFAPELALEEELAATTRRLADAPAEEAGELVKRQGALHAEFERLGGYSIASRTEAALAGLGLPPATWRRRLHELSGGERRRGMLAATLLGGGDLLLLDEPTNHLDLAACEWLEDYLAESPAAAVLVSHDRQFLDRVTSHTWHLHAGRLTAFAGAYTAFARWHEEQQKQALAAWERQQERIRKTEDFIRRNIAGQKSRQAQSRRKALAKEERLTPPPAAARPYTLRLAPQRESGAVVLEVEGLAKAYEGRPVVEGLSLLVARGERIGVVGPNGSGKSTLLKLLAGIVFPDRGTVRLGFGVDLGYYDQHQRTVRDDRTVLAEAATMDPIATEGELRSFLGAFGFGADLVDRPVGALSGGERGRLSLLKLIKEGHNTLLLDEPTNHLDIRCREALERALTEFAGTLIVVSHDRRFLDRLVTRLLVFPADGEPASPPRAGSPRAGGAPAGRTPPGEEPASRPRLFLGNYEQWHERQLALAGPRAGPPVAVRLAGTGGRGFGAGSGAPGAAPGAASGDRPAASRDGARDAGCDAGGGPAGAAALSKNEVVRRQAWMAEAEARIAALEGERDGIVAALADPRLEPERLRERADRLARLEAELAEQLALWEKWGREIEGATGGG